MEARLPEHGQDHFDTGSANSPSPVAQGTKLHRRPSRRRSEELSEDDDRTLVDGVAYLSLCASGTTDTTPEPFYLGSSSGATIARMIQSSIFRSAKFSLAGSISPGQQDVLRPSQVTADLTQSSVPEMSLDPTIAEFPSRSQAAILFSVFFDRLHTRWPILDRKLYSEYFEQQWTQGVLSPVQKSMLHMIYAISSRFLQLMKKDHHVEPQVHLAAAVGSMEYILEQHNLCTVQFLTLLAIHGQRAPYGAGSWSQVRYALTTCVELGFHRDHTPKSPAQTARELEIRRRVFWACYCLDRETSLVLGRTFGIADRDIDVELPSSKTEFWDLTSTGPPPPEVSEPWSNIHPFIHIIKLRQLQSKIHRTVFRVDKDILHPTERSKLDRKVTAINKSLDDWVATTPSPPRDAKCNTEGSYHHDSRDYFTLQYHKTVLTLFTALLPTLSTSDARFQSGAKSAARVCTAYKRLNQQKTLSYTITGLHGCFVAGLTLVYCLWRDASLFSYQSLEAVRACSLCLTVFGEKWPGAVKYRDIFDALSASLFKAIAGPKGVEEAQGQATTEVEVEKPVEEARRGKRKPLEINMQRNQQLPSPKIGGQEQRKDISSASPKAMVLGAVKDMFMEVDDDAPGGWQGWRMFSEMVQQDGDMNMEWVGDEMQFDGLDGGLGGGGDFQMEDGASTGLAQQAQPWR